MTIKPKRYNETVHVVSPDDIDYYLNFVEYTMLRADINRASETGWKVWIQIDGNDCLFDIDTNGRHHCSEYLFNEVDQSLCDLAFFDKSKLT